MIPAAEIQRMAGAAGVESSRVDLYRGSLPIGGSPRSIQVHLSLNEVILMPPETRHLTHPYSDSMEMKAAGIRCYSLVEVLAEKLRAVCGQRRYAIARDVYDIHELVRRGTALREALTILPAKFKVKGLSLPASLVQSLEDRRADFEQDWARNLTPLLLPRDRIPIEDAWTTVREAVSAVQVLPSG